MSAYQVSQDTIDLIVSVIVGWGKHRGGWSPNVYTYGAFPTDEELRAETEQREGYLITRGDMTTADALGRELIDANVRSLASRYSDGVEMCHYFSEAYTWQPVNEAQATVQRAMGAVNCYRYQACESSDWRGSFAEELTNTALHRLIDMIATGWDYSREESPKIVSIFEMGGQ